MLQSHICSTRYRPDIKNIWSLPPPRPPSRLSPWLHCLASAHPSLRQTAMLLQPARHLLGFCVGICPTVERHDFVPLFPHPLQHLQVSPSSHANTVRFVPRRLGGSCSRAHRSTSGCPSLAAQAQTLLSNEQGGLCSRIHCSSVKPWLPGTTVVQRLPTPRRGVYETAYLRLVGREAQCARATVDT